MPTDPILHPLPPGDLDFFLALLRLIHGDADHVLDVLRANEAGEEWVSRKRMIVVLAHLQKRETMRAVAQARDLVHDDPQLPGGWAMLAVCLHLDRETAEAVQAGREAVLRASDNAYAHLLLGFLLVQDKQIDEAIEAYLECLRRNPTLEEVYHKVAALYTKQGDREKSLDIFKQGLRLNPTLPGRVALATLYQHEGEYEAAKHELEAAQNLIPQPAILHQLAVVHRQLGHPEEAMALYQKVLEMNPRRWQSQYDLGCMYLQDARYSEAVDAFRKVLKVLADFVPAHVALAEGLAHLGETEAARESLQAGLALAPDDPDGRALLATLLQPDDDG